MQRVIFHRLKEKGAIGVIVAVLFGFGVMTAAAALSIDVGNINTNRRQLQNGADAVALAAVKQCVTTGVCPDANDTGLIALENANANPDAATGVTGIRRVDGATPICGVGGGLPACPTSPSTENIQECPQPSLVGTNYLRAYTQTTNAAGAHLLPYSFGAAIAGVSSGANQQSCAAVGWGPLKAAAALPITFSYCDWKAQTGANPPSNPGTYFPAPTGNPAGYGGAGQPAYPAASAERILFTAKASTPGCSTWNGHNDPGGFGGVLEAPGKICSATIPADGWLQTDTGNDAPCKGDTIKMADLIGTVAYLPIFDCIVKSPVTITAGTDCASGDGKNTYYHVMGFAAFFISGYNFSGDGAKSLLTNDYPCKGGGDRCISGWFVKALIPSGEIDFSGAPNLGTTAMKILG